MKNVITTCLFILVMFYMAAVVVKGEVIVHEVPASFNAVAVDTTTDLGLLSVAGSNPGFPPLLAPDHIYVATDGNLFQATAVFAPQPFKAFAARFFGVAPGIFSVFIDGNFMWSRPANLNDESFFLGFTGDFDLLAVSANTGPYAFNEIQYTVAPEPSVLILLIAGLILISPYPTWRR